MKRLALLLVLLMWCIPAHAAISPIASVSCFQITANGVSTFTCNVPPGTANNDFLVFSVGYQNNTPATPTAPGFTLIAYDSSANGFVGVVSMGKCANSEGSTETITTGTGVTWGTGQLTAYRGTICPTYPVQAAAGGTSHGFSTSVAIPALGGSTATANEWAIQVAAVAPSSTASAYTQPAPATVDGTIVNTGTGQQAGLGVSHIVYPSSGSTVTAQTGSLSVTNSWAGLQFTLFALGCSTLTSQCVCPNGAGLPGVCECGSTTVSTLLNCFIVPSGTNETAMVTDGGGSCSPGTTPASGGTTPFSVAWSGTAWVCN